MQLLYQFGILGFLLLSNISFQIPIGIAILVLIIWRFLEYKNTNKSDSEKFKKSEKVLLIIGLLISVIISVFFYDYLPINSLEKKEGINYLISYTYDSFIVFNRNIKYENYSCLATFISVFPVGLLIGIVIIFKEKVEHYKFIVPSVIISILELIFVLSNISLYFFPNYIMMLGFNLLQIYMIVYIFSRIDEKFFGLTKSAYIVLIMLVLLIFMPVPSSLKKGVYLDCLYILFVLENYIVLNYSDKRFWRLASWVFTIICAFEFIGYLIVTIQSI